MTIAVDHQISAPAIETTETERPARLAMTSRRRPGRPLGSRDKTVRKRRPPRRRSAVEHRENAT